MKKLLFICGVTSCLVAGQSFATEDTSTLTANGNLIASSCDFDIQDPTGTSITSLALPDISESDVYKLTFNQANTSPTLSGDFKLSFSNCVNTESVRISYTEDATPSGTAAGLDLVLSADGILQDGSSVPNFDLSGLNNGEKSFSVNYKRTAEAEGDISVGNVSKAFNFVVTYL